MPAWLVAIVVALAVSACHGGGDTGRAQLAVSVSALTAANVETVSVSATNGTDTLTTVLTAGGGTWRGTMSDIPAGAGWVFTGTAYDASSTPLFTGSSIPVTITARQTATVYLALSPVTPPPSFGNHAPHIDSIVVSSVAVAPGDVVNLAVGASDADGDALVYAWSGDPQGVFTTPDQTSTDWSSVTAGMYPLTITVTDPHHALDAATISIDVDASNARGAADLSVTINAFPEVQNVILSTGHLRPGVPETATVHASDSDGDPLAISWSDDCGGAWAPLGANTAGYTLPIGSTATSCTLRADVADGRGGTNFGTLTVTVGPDLVTAAPSGLMYATSPAIYTLGEAIASNTPALTGGDPVDVYAVSPALPPGLALDPGTGVITGTPTAIVPTASYTITARNEGGATQTVLVVTVNDLAPSALVYPSNPATYTKGVAITPNAPAFMGGTTTTFSVSPALPAGLTLDPASGVIAGTPLVLASVGSYTITATNSGGSAGVILTIAVNEVAPSALSYPTNPATYVVNQPIAANVPSVAGGPVTGYAVAPGLPAGLSLDPSTGVISGTPTAVTGTGTYVVTATNSGGSTTASVSITVNPLAPAAPTGLTAAFQSTTGVISINWNAASGAASYKIYYSTSSTVTTASAVLGPMSSTSFTHTGIYAGSYYYRVSAINAGGESPLSNLVTTTVPGNISVSPGGIVASGRAPFGVAVGDLNADGKPDIAVANSGDSTVSVFLDATAPGATTITLAPKLTLATGSGPQAVAIADVNGDGKPDVVVANAGASTLSILLDTTAAGATTPSFAPRVDIALAGATPMAIAVGDLNTDGKPDLAVPMQSSGTALALINTTPVNSTTPSFAISVLPSAATPSGVAIGDLNGDGRPDVAVANQGSDSISVMLNTTVGGSVSFAGRVTFATSSPTAVAIGDLNGDGRPDLAAATFNTSTASVLLSTTNTNATTPTFAAAVSFATGMNPLSLAIVDLDGDGRPELVTASESNDTGAIFRNTTAAFGSPPSFATRLDVSLASVPTAVASGDFDGDGKPDLAFAAWGSDGIRIVRNTTMFAQRVDFAAGANPHGIAVGDLDGDGKRDVVVTNGTSNTISIFTSTTTSNAAVPSFATHVDLATGSTPLAVAIADLNADGKPDLAVANFAGSSISVFLNTTASGARGPSFAARVDVPAGTNVNACDVAIGDLDGDGKPDLATVARFGSNKVSVIRNTMAAGATTPSFATAATFATGPAPFAVALGDLNGDGKLDLAIADEAYGSMGAGTVSVLLNTTASAGSPTFAATVDVPTGTSSVAVAIGDVNGDGKPDLAVANQDSGTVSILLDTTAAGAATPTFAPRLDIATGSVPLGVAFSDLDRDGRPDLLVTNNGAKTVSLLLDITAAGATTAAFATKQDLATAAGPVGIASADINGNGRPDVCIANSSANTMSVLTDPF